MSRTKIVAPILAPNEHVSNKRNTTLRCLLAARGMSIRVVLLLVDDTYISFDAILDIGLKHSLTLLIKETVYAKYGMSRKKHLNL